MYVLRVCECDGENISLKYLNSTNSYPRAKILKKNSEINILSRFHNISIKVQKKKNNNAQNIVKNMQRPSIMQMNKILL